MYVYIYVHIALAQVVSAVERLTTEPGVMVTPLGGISAHDCKQPGDLITLVGKIEHAGPVCLFKALWHQETYELHSQTLQQGIWTLYDYCFDTQNSGPPVLKQLATSRSPPCGARGPESFRGMIELCCGLGGIAIGAARVAVATKLRVDQTNLACDTIASNGGQVLKGNLTRPDVQEAIHACIREHAGAVAAGFPC